MSGSIMPESLKLVKMLPFENDGFRFLEVIGSGSYSVVFKVLHLKTNLHYAAKAIPTAITKMSMIQSELEMMKQLKHSNIIKLYSYFQEFDHLFMILQLCENGTIERFIETNKGMSDDLLWYHMKTILESLSYMHSRMISHRDIKPQNIFIDKYNRPLLGDFGFATKSAQGDLSNCYLGSFMFKSPEILKKVPFDPFKADIWALGVTFLIMMTGNNPWPMNSVNDQLTAILENRFQVPLDFPVEKLQVIRMMLQLNPKNRASLDELLEYPSIRDAKQQMQKIIVSDEQCANISSRTISQFIRQANTRIVRKPFGDNFPIRRVYSNVLQQRNYSNKPKNKSNESVCKIKSLTVAPLSEKSMNDNV